MVEAEGRPSSPGGGPQAEAPMAIISRKRVGEARVFPIILGFLILFDRVPIRANAV
jgi:hypothetical protein